MDPSAFTIETLLDFPADENNKLTIFNHPSSSSTTSSNPDETAPEKLEWIDDKDSFPSVDTYIGISTIPPAPIYKHLSPISVLENNTVTNTCDGLATSETRSRKTSRGKKRVPAENSDDPDYPYMPTEEQDLDSSRLTKKRKVTSSNSGRMCQHCETKETPQWRAGPTGPKTLCNACGVRYKSGRLVPEYRPANSPTFSSRLHSNSHRKVMQMMTQKMDDVQELRRDAIISTANTLSVVLGSAFLHLPVVGGMGSFCPCPSMPILKQPSSSSTPSSNLEDITPVFLPEKLECIDDKESFPSVDTFVSINTIPPARIYKHLSPISVLENNTVTSAPVLENNTVTGALDSLATSVTRSRRTLRGKKRVQYDFYFFMPNQEQDLHSNDLVQTQKGKLTCSTSRRKCQHCEAQETPQWRAGPMGPKSLCNACGVRRYKSGRRLLEVPAE